MHRHFRATAARTEILQQSGKDLAQKGREYALDVPCTCTPTLTLLLQPLLFMQCQFILLLSEAAHSQRSKSQSHGLVIKSATAFSVSPSQGETTVSRHFVFHFTEFPKHCQTSNLEKTPNLCVQESQFNTKDFYSSADTTEARLTCTGMDVQCNHKLHHTIN